MPKSDRPLVQIYTDGACSPNPGTGGWGAILLAPELDGAERELSGGERDSTNNRMELTAALEGLRALKGPSRVEIHTDSQYLRNAFAQDWIGKWQRNGWQTAAKKPVKNEDLWRALIEQTTIHDVEWKWLRGHNAHPLNERADRLAVAAREKIASR